MYKNLIALTFFVCLCGISIAVLPNTDMPGSDMASFVLSAGDPSTVCAQRCLDNPSCRAWTYVKSGVWGAEPHCLLKSSVPQAVSDQCCESGVRTDATVVPAVGVPVPDATVIPAVGTPIQDATVIPAVGIPVQDAIVVPAEGATSIQTVRPTFKGDPAACAWYTNTGITADGPARYIWESAPSRGLEVYDSIDVFARANNDSLLRFNLRGNYRPTVSVVLPNVKIGSSPSVVQRGPRTIDVFATMLGSPDVIIQFTQDNLGRWSTNSQTGISNGQGLAASSWGPDRIDLFQTASNGNVWHRSLNGREWSSWESLGSPPGGSNSAPASGSYESGQIDVAVRTPENRYYIKSYGLGGWSDWEMLRGSTIFYSPPAISATPMFPGGGGDRKIQYFGRCLFAGDIPISFIMFGRDSWESDILGGNKEPDSALAAINYVGTHYTVFAREQSSNQLVMCDWDIGCCDDREDYQWTKPDFVLPNTQTVIGR